MNFHSGTHISIFDPAAYANSQSLPQETVQRISDGYMAMTTEERQASASLMGSIEEAVLAKVLTSQGFEITVKGPGVSDEVGITDPYSNPYLLNLWTEELSKALLHGMHHGFAAIVMRTIYEPGTDPIVELKRELEQQVQDEDAEAEGSWQGKDKDETNEEMKEFFREEYRRLKQQRPKPTVDLGKDSTKSYRLPRVLDPLNEYWLGRTFSVNGVACYKAFSRDRTDHEVEIPDSFVFVFREPNSYGMPSSMFLDCLADIQALRAMLDRYHVRDWDNTRPIYFYQSKQRTNQAIIPNETHISFAATGVEDTDEMPRVSTQTGWTGPKDMAVDSLKRRKQLLAEATHYMQEAVSHSIQKTIERGTELQMPTFHAQLGHLSRLPPITQFEPFIVIPDQVELSPNVPRVIHSTDWLPVIRILQTNIANACGILPSSLTGERAVVGSDIQQNREDNNTRIRKLQRQMERLIGAIYVQVFTPIHKQQIAYSIEEVRYQSRMRLMMDADTRERLRYNLQREYEQLTEEIELTMEAGARSEVVDRRTHVLREINRIPNFDQNAESFPWDQDEELGQLGNRSSEYWRIRVEERLKVVVHVFENPDISFDELQKLFQAGVLDELEFRKLSLRVLGLPRDYISKMPLGQMIAPPNAPEKREGAGGGSGKTDSKTSSKDKAKKKAKKAEKKEKKKARKAEQPASSKRQKSDAE